MRETHIVVIWSHSITVIPTRSNYAGNGCISRCSVLGFVCKHKTTYILPSLVMKLIENKLIVRNVVVMENGLSFRARWVHMLESSVGKGAKESR